MIRGLKRRLSGAAPMDQLLCAPPPCLECNVVEAVLLPSGQARDRLGVIPYDLGPEVFERLTRTLLLTYNPALFAAGAACLLAAMSVMMIRRPQQPPTTAQTRSALASRAS